MHRTELTWDRVFHVWQERIAPLGCTFSDPFITVHVHDPKQPTGRETRIDWWPTSSVHMKRKQLQHHFNRYPGTNGFNWPESRGQFTTLEFLSRHRSDPQMQAAILIRASMFSRLHSSQRQYPIKYWPSYSEVAKIDGVARDFLNEREGFCCWSTACTGVLPYSQCDYNSRINSTTSLIRYLADEHSILFRNYVPVEIIFDALPDAELEAELLRDAGPRMSVQEIRQRKLDEEHNEQIAKENREEELRQRTRLHPQWNEWKTLSRDELQTLVWTEPTTAIAIQFGISGTAIAKACAVKGIPKPPRGYWNRVASGKTPHPQGKPMVEPKSRLKLRERR